MADSKSFKPEPLFSGYKESFRFFDRSGKGYITADDFRRALTQIQCGRPPSEEQVADLMKEYDLSGKCNNIGVAPNTQLRMWVINIVTFKGGHLMW